MDSRLKRRNHLCYLLRAAGIEVDTKNHAIQATSPEDIENLTGANARRVRALLGEYHYVVQFRIPDLPGSGVVGDARKFRRPRRENTETATAGEQNPPATPQT
jgi:hypothetical protein